MAINEDKRGEIGVKRGLRALIDADVLVYRIGYASQKKFYVAHTTEDAISLEGKTLLQAKVWLKKNGYDGSNCSIKTRIRAKPVSHALHSTKLAIEAIMSDTKASDFVLFLTSNDKSNFRFKAATIKPYKGNRHMPKPVHYDAIRSFLFDKGATEVSGIEADDAMGIQQCQEKNTIICSIDKDMRMIPGMHYNIETKDIFEATDFGEVWCDKNSPKGYGLKWFYAQMLLGDNADNIPGIVGMGKAKVSKLLSDVTSESSGIKAVMDFYKKQYGADAEKAFAEVADLLWIMREHNVKYSDRRIK